MVIKLKDKEISFDHLHILIKKIAPSLNDFEAIYCHSVADLIAMIKKYYIDDVTTSTPILSRIVNSQLTKDYDDLFKVCLMAPGTIARKFDYSIETDDGWYFALFSKKIKYKKSAVNGLIPCDQILCGTARDLDSLVLTDLSALESRYIPQALFSAEPRKQPLLFDYQGKTWCLTKNYVI